MIGFKKLDRFVLRSYLTLFCAAFCVALFIFIMQFLWRYVDDLAGKGLTITVLGEFFFWASITLIPAALPLAILLAAIITFGNLGEYFELTAIKAGGISLLRLMAPLVVFCTMLAGVSFYFQNETAPKAQIKMWTLLLSIKQTSPEMDIPEGVFYSQIPRFNLYVKYKNPKTRALHEVTIYDFSNGFSQVRIIKADSARLSITGDQAHLWLDLYNGEQFENIQTQSNRFLNNVPSRRETFQEKRILIEFNMNFEKMDETFMTRQYMSKNLFQLRESIDSINIQIDSIGKMLYDRVRTTTYNPVLLSQADSARLEKSSMRQVDIDSVFGTMTPVQLRGTLQQAQQTTKSMDWELQGMTAVDSHRFLRLHKMAWHTKFTLALTCIIFFFIGASLGGIIRKGGIGMPIVVAVVFYVVYYIIDIAGQKMAREGVWPVWGGIWLSTFSLVPIAVFLTHMANRDSTVFSMELYKSALFRLLGLREKRNIVCKDIVLDTPDYPTITMQELPAIQDEARNYLETQHPERPANYALFFREMGQDEQIAELSKRVEALCKQLGNSLDRQVLELINELPALSAHAHQAPFRRRWLNVAAGVIFPIGLCLYIRIWRFRLRLYKDLKQIVQVSDQLKERISVLLQTEQ